MTRGSHRYANIRQMPPPNALAEAPERLGLRVTMVQLAVYADLSPRLTGLGLSSPSRMTALLHIRAHPGCSQSELAEFTGLSRPSAATMVGQIEAAGFVKRRPGADGRTNALFLTEAGAAAIDRSHEQTAANEARIFGTLTAGERETLRQLLEKVIFEVERVRTEERHTTG